jgi:hypothetical protein
MPEVWLPVSAWTDPEFLNNRGGRDFDLLGRLRTGVSIEEARTELDTIANRLALTFPATNQGVTYAVSAMVRGLYQSMAIGVIALCGPILILMICCANISGMTLALAHVCRLCR